MLLATVRFDLLFEITRFVERPDANERQAKITGRFAMVAGEDAETARVRAQAFVEAELAREIREWPTGVFGMVS